ncbi:flippase [Hanstruepera marina]|uniref:flippase n=1 Tax=Hanstruepera marina TaxID=2873265 RepID=UPI001CA765D8|nr:flippase [Hanstruepera marina]
MYKLKKKISHLKNDFDFIELIKGSLTSFLGKILGMTFGYIAGIFIANKYGAEELGIYSLCLTVLSLVVLIPKFGFDNSLIKILNEVLIKGNKTNFISVLKRTSVFSLGLAILASIILYFSSGYISTHIFKNVNLTNPLIATSFAIVPTTLLVIASGTYQALKKTFQHMLFKTALINVVFVGFLVLNYFLLDSYGEIMMLYCGASYITLIIAVFFVFTSLKKIPFKKGRLFNYKNWDIFNISYPMLFSNSFALLLGWVNVLLLGYFISEFGVGIYDSAEKLAALSNLALIAVNSIAAPKFAEAHSKDNIHELKAVMQKSTKMIFFITAPLLLILIVFGKPVLGLYGSEFIVGYWCLVFLCLGRFISSISGSVGYLLQMTGQQKTFQNVVFLAFIINLILSLILIPRFGILGAAVSKCIAIVFWNVTLVIIIKKRLGFWTFYIPFIVK